MLLAGSCYAWPCKPFLIESQFDFWHRFLPSDFYSDFSDRKLGFWLTSVSSYNSNMSTASYLDRFLEPVTAAMTPELAQTLVELQADPKLQAEIEVLRQKANDGSLTANEEAAYKDFVEAVDVVSVLQSKASRFLKRPSA